MQALLARHHRKSGGNMPLRLSAKDGTLDFEIETHVENIKRFAGVAPAVVLNNPIYARNLSGVMRACAAWGVGQLWWTGDRITAEIEGMSRLPREERMRGYNSVKLLWHDQPLRFFAPPVQPVCVELVPGAVQLHHFEHPENAVYVFGPEQGSVSKGLRVECHHFVKLPTAHCINLAAAVNVILAHRRFQRIERGLESDKQEWLDEARGPLYSMSQEG